MNNRNYNILESTLDKGTNMLYKYRCVDLTTCILDFSPSLK